MKCKVEIILDVCLLDLAPRMVVIFFPFLAFD
jgi:hypothetical protein